MICSHTVSLGAYVLGALEPGERAEFETHLADCPICRPELVRMSPLPGLLNQITEEDFADREPDGIEPLHAAAETELPPEFRPRTVRARRPRTRLWLAAAAAALVVLAAAGGVLVYRAVSDGPVQVAADTITWSGQDPASGAHADVALVGRPWGTQFNLQLQRRAAGQAVQARRPGEGRRTGDRWLVVADLQPEGPDPRQHVGRPARHRQPADRDRRRRGAGRHPGADRLTAPPTRVLAGAPVPSTRRIAGRVERACT